MILDISQLSTRPLSLSHLKLSQVLLSFVDNQCSKTLELRKSWRLHNVVWGQAFTNIVRQDDQGPGTYQIDVEALDQKMVRILEVRRINKMFRQELSDQLNETFAPLAVAEQIRESSKARNIGRSIFVL